MAVSDTRDPKSGGLQHFIHGANAIALRKRHRGSRIGRRRSVAPPRSRRLSAINPTRGRNGQRRAAGA